MQNFLASEELSPLILTATIVRSQGKDYATILQMGKLRLRGFKYQDTKLESGAGSFCNHSHRNLAGTLEASLREGAGDMGEDCWGFQPFDAPVKRCFCLESCLKAHYVEMVGVRGAL